MTTIEQRIEQRTAKTTGELLRNYSDLVSYVLWHIVTDPDLNPSISDAAGKLFRDSSWKGNVVAKFVLKTEVKPREEQQAEREALYGAMADMGYELPSLLEPQS